MKYPKPSPPPAVRTLRALMKRFKLKAHEVAYFIDRKPQTVRAYLCGARAMPSAHVDTIKRAVWSK